MLTPMDIMLVNFVILITPGNSEESNLVSWPDIKMQVITVIMANPTKRPTVSSQA